jgi:DNA-binding transcriptional regulator LsrR (DeoR family)
MAQRRVSMKKAKEILRLKFEAGLGNHKIARACGVSASTVWDTVTRFETTGIGWPLPEGMSEGVLERRLYRKRGPWKPIRSGYRTGPRCRGNSDIST